MGNRTEREVEVPYRMLFREQAHRYGLTLVELVIVVLIIGIIASVAAPKYADTLQRYRAEKSAGRIEADLALARAQAMSTSTNQSVVFTPSTKSYTMPGIAHLDHPSQSYSVELAEAPYCATALLTNLGDDSTIQFDHFGEPDGGGSVTVYVGNIERTVIIDPDTGRASVQ